jgi:hypothetical protein
MKSLRNVLLGEVAAGVLLIQLPLAAQVTPDHKGIDPGQIKLEIDPAKLMKPDVKWQVYTLASQQVSAASFQALLGEFLGADAARGKINPINDRLTYVSPNDASVYCTQDINTGNLSLKKSLAAYFGNNTPNLPDSQTAERVARESLQRHKLAPKNPGEMKMIHAGGMRMTSTQDGRGGPTIDKLRTINFGRKLDGVAVQGSGSKIVVNLGDRGDVVSLNRRWREVANARAVQREEFKDPQQIGDEIRRFLATQWNEAREIGVRRVALVYYDGDGKFIQPAWMFEATILEGDTKLEYIGAIPALKKPPENIGPASLPPEAKSLLKGPKDRID